MTTYPECISTLNTIIQLMQTYLCLVVVVVFFFALKLVTQGGWTANDTKYRSAKGFVNRVPMLITCQTPMDFGKNHNAAMDSRLTKYTFKTLPSVDPTAIAWLEKHPMDCIHWAATQISSLPRSTGVETPKTSAGELDEEEIKEPL